MKLRDLLENVDVLESTADPELEITGVCYDSRAAKPGDLFVAVRGFSSDGHAYIPKAMEKGAAAVLCETAPNCGIPWVRTEDCRLGLALASRAFFGDPASEMTMIGITGTNGKTTSSYLLKHLLESRPGTKVGLIGTNGVMIGDAFISSERTTPESYELHRLFREMADAGCTHVVMEVSSHSLSLKRVAGIRYDVGVFTNLTQDHLDFHGSMEEYAAAKRLLFRQCAVGVFNLDDPWATFMMEDAACTARTYSAEDNAADLVAKDIRLSASGVRFAAVSESEIALTRLAIPGMFSVHNALCVLAAGQALGIPLRDCAAALQDAKGVKGRMELVPSDGDYAILIDYAHTPDALENVLKTLKSVTSGRLIVLFGCGGDRDKGKRPIMGAIAEQYADVCIVTSDNPRTEEPMQIIEEILAGMKRSRASAVTICDRIEAIHWAIDKAAPGDVILLAGKGHEDYQEVGHEKHHMDERELVADYLAERKNAR
ncbi:MAG: UDP-N-acetylmuramoyl-L-alanyl-D-glutamate--2,6-diaminopimelate ligase [Oscillospiraceae bacterium]|nr:UDP-N-acetylmuramoyl-L-alanyl-D-glutamate--2,6-diaminopimelate ligase [Oscillospiraceae bacterium]